MSLFENDQYHWRETYFVLFDEARRPRTEALLQALNDVSGRFELRDVRSDGDGKIESLTVISPDDYAAMDISYICGEEVAEQAAEIAKELSQSPASAEDQALLHRLAKCTGRLDVYHFEKTVSAGPDEVDEGDLMDPGALLTVLQRLAMLCQGIALDPQSGILL